MKNWSISRRLMTGFGAVVFLLLVLVVTSISVSREISSMTKEAERIASVQDHAVELRGAAHEMAVVIRDVALFKEGSAREVHINKLKSLHGEYQNAEKEIEAQFALRAGNLPAELTALYEATHKTEDKATASTVVLVDMLKAGDLVEAQKFLAEVVSPAYSAWVGNLTKLINYEESRIASTTAEMVGASSQKVLIICVLALLALAVGVVSMMVVSRSITGELGGEPVAVRRVLLALRDGDLTVSVPVRAGDTTSIMASLSDVRTRLHGLVSVVRRNVDSVASAGAEIAAGNQQLGAQSELSASSIEETAASMDHITSSVKQASDSAQQANHLASIAAKTAEGGGVVMSDVVETMNEINVSSQKISDIIGVIDGIAFQTNILALNAAVEAARAGEQGRGFAVVASEVRSLAQRSANAAKEIKSLITDSVERVQKGSELVNRAGQAVDEVVRSIRQVSDIVGEISAASREQSDSVMQVGSAVKQLDTATQQNASMVEGMIVATRSLQQQAEDLRRSVATFNLGGVASVSLPAVTAAPVVKRPETQSKPAAVKSSPVAKPRIEPSATPAPKAASAIQEPTLDGDWEQF